MLNNFYLLLSIFFFFFILKVWYVKKVLLLLLTLEYLNIILFLFFYEKFYSDSNFYIMSLIFISLCVTEGVLGLCLFMKMTRSCGEDRVRSINKKS